ncbi:MAG TPA: hypothetical protein VF381_13140 [Thermoanaerobaculia bacterium]
MIDSIAFYAGTVTAFGGAIAMLRKRSRKRGAIVAASGVAVAAVALFWPVPDLKQATGDTLLDRHFTKWQFDEVHSIGVDASPERAYDAVRKVTPREILLFRTLTAIRRFGRKAPEGILNAPKNEPILDVATRTSFRLLDDAPPREVVVGVVIIPPRRAVGAMSFLVTPIAANRCRITTETRVYAADPQAARTFAGYWRIIHPGSDIIRRMWLRAIKRRAEQLSS